MSAPEEYVVRASNGDLLHDSYMSEQEARQVSRRYGPYATVHKLGPAIEPPEPKEWVVVAGEYLLHPYRLQTRADAERSLRDLSANWSDLRIARIVFEDPA